MRSAVDGANHLGHERIPPTVHRIFLGHWTRRNTSSGILWAQLQQDGAQTITPSMLRNALALSGFSFDGEDQKVMLQPANQNLARYEDVRKLHIPNDLAPPFYFSSIVPGMKVNRTHLPLRFSSPRVRRPANLEEVAFWPVTQLAQLIRTLQVTSVELTQMYLTRLHRYNDKRNCVVTLLDELALAKAKHANAEIASGRHRGPLHGIPGAPRTESSSIPGVRQLASEAGIADTNAERPLPTHVQHLRSCLQQQMCTS
jgi:Amidase